MVTLCQKEFEVPFDLIIDMFLISRRISFTKKLIGGWNANSCIFNSGFRIY